MNLLETERDNHLKEIDSLKKDLEDMVSVSFPVLTQLNLTGIARSSSTAVGRYETR